MEDKELNSKATINEDGLITVIFSKPGKPDTGGIIKIGAYGKVTIKTLKTNGDIVILSEGEFDLNTISMDKSDLISTGEDVNDKQD